MTYRSSDLRLSVVSIAPVADALDNVFSVRRLFVNFLAFALSGVSVHERGVKTCPMFYNPVYALRAASALGR